MKLIATKSMRYRTRRLQAGDEFEETNAVFARVLVGARKAQYAPEKPVVEAEPAPQFAPRPEPAEHAANIDDLRDEAEALGIDVDGRWGVVRLQAEIARAKL